MVYLCLANGFEEVEAFAPLDLLRRAGVEVYTVGIGGEVITGAHGIQVRADITEEQTEFSPSLEMLILPGGSEGTENLNASKTVHELIDYAMERGIYIAAICAAPTILGRRGILEGRCAVCYPGLEKMLTDANVTDRAVVVDDTIITARGMGVALQFGLELVHLLCGEDTAKELRLTTLIAAK